MVYLLYEFLSDSRLTSSDEFVKGFSHNEQLNPFSPVWILEWTFTWL